MSRVYQCLIADDNVIERDVVEMYLSQISGLSIVALCNNGVETANALGEQNIDIVFTDIDMPGLSGLELKRSLQHSPVFVFISAYAEHAAESYELDVIDFVSKPATLARLMKASQKAIEYIELKNALASTPFQQFSNLAAAKHPFKTEEGYFYIKDGANFTRVETKDVVFIESMGNFSRLHTAQHKKLITLVSLKNIEQQLPAAIFLRVHKQYIVNLQHLQSLSAEGELTLSNGQAIPSGAIYRSALLDFINSRTLSR